VSVSRSRTLSLAWLVVLVAAPIAAAVLVPDPSWVSGVYDAGDTDAVVQLVWDLAGGVVPTMSAPALLPGVPHAAQPPAVSAPSRSAARSDSRAPPVR
jgi:hypothetical protein